MAKTDEFESFNTAMDAILRADPKAVKQAMEDEKQANAEQRRIKKVKDGKET